MHRAFEWRVVVFLLLHTLIGSGWAEENENAGEKAFKTTCFACHTIGGGRLVGPDLAGIQDRRSGDWSVRFIRSSQSMVREGDADAIALVEEFNGLVMPDTSLSTTEIEAILRFIVVESALSGGTEPSALASTAGGADDQRSTTPDADPPAERISRGRHLFEGTIDFENAGPTCNACHHVKDDAVLGGGALAVELTTAFSRMGAPGLRAIITQAPFPAMQAAYAAKPLTEDEVSDLAAYLQHADAEHVNQTPKNYGLRLFAGGVAGSAALFGFCGFVWRGRKRGSVNQDIYDRQMKSD